MIIVTFVQEWVWAIACLLGLGLSGYFVLVPFRSTSPNIVMAAPFAGILVMVLLMMAGYSFLRWPMERAALLAWVGTAGLSAIALWYRALHVRWWHGAVIAGLSAVAVLVCCTATLRFHSPSITFFDGTDQAGYAQMGDWLLAHKVDAPPGTTPLQPYESYPAYLFLMDPRFGIFAFLSLVASVRRVSALFAYDPVVALLLTSGISAIAGLVGQRARAVLVVMAGLFVSEWYDYTEVGFLGKLISYPGIVFLATLLLLHWRRSGFDQGRLDGLALLLMTAALSISYSGQVLGFFLLFMVGSAVLLALRRERPLALVPVASTLVSLILVALCATGALAKPLSFYWPDYHTGWTYVILRSLDLENPSVSVLPYGRATLKMMTAAAIVFWAALILLTVRSRKVVATTLVVAPAVLLGTVFLLDQTAFAYQITGLLFPFVLCGAVLLLEGETRRGRQAAVCSAILLSLAIRVPRLVFDIDRYAWRPLEGYEFSKKSVDRVLSQVAGRTVRIDIVDPVPALVMLDELGKRISPQYSAVAWQTLFAYRAWPLPTYGTPANVTVSWDKKTGFTVAPTP